MSRKETKSASMTERTQRSVFVGNIPYEATEAQLTELFSRAGQVVSFRLMHDRETGRSKGYGFCEFVDKETAASALRNMNNMEFNGRNLRIDAASGERTKEEIRQMHLLMAAAEEEACYGPSAVGVDVCRAISNALSEMPRDQLIEFLSELESSLRTNPNETRGLLCENPQLSYAVLVSLTSLQLIDKDRAISLLHPPYATIDDYSQSFSDAIIPGQYVPPGAEQTQEESRTMLKGADVQLAQTSSDDVQSSTWNSESALARFDSLDEETKQSIISDLMRASEAELNLLPNHMKQLMMALRVRYSNARA